MAHLIDKSAVVAEIERRMQCYSEDGCEPNSGKWVELISIKHFINTLEVKEVDLDYQHFAKEMAEVFALPSSITKNTEEEPLNWEYAIAKHFFELGLKAKQG